MDVHLRNLRYFVAVAEDLHFSRAAARLHVSQPALSKQVRQLERDLRFPLFRRDRRGVELTAAGAALLPEARRLLELWEEALSEATRRASEEAALLRVGFQTSVYGGLYQDAAARFRELRPSWRLDLRSYPWSDPSAGLLDGRVDVAFVWLPVPEVGRLDVHVLRREACHVALPARHRLARRRGVTMADLLDEPFVALPPEAGVQRDFWLALDARGGRPARVGAEAGTPDETFEAVAAGRGVVFLSEGNARLYARPGIVSLPVEGLSPCELAVARRRGDARREVEELVQAAVAAAEVAGRP